MRFKIVKGRKYKVRSNLEAFDTGLVLGEVSKEGDGRPDEVTLELAAAAAHAAGEVR